MDQQIVSNLSSPSRILDSTTQARQVPRARRRFCARRIPLPWHVRILTSYASHMVPRRAEIHDPPA